MKKAIPILVFVALFFTILYVVLFALHRMSNTTTNDTWHVSFKRPFDTNNWTYEIEQLTTDKFDMQSIELHHGREELIHITQFEEGTTIEDFDTFLHPFYLRSTTNVIEKGKTYKLTLTYQIQGKTKRDILDIN